MGLIHTDIAYPLAQKPRAAVALQRRKEAQEPVARAPGRTNQGAITARAAAIAQAHVVHYRRLGCVLLQVKVLSAPKNGQV